MVTPASPKGDRREIETQRCKVRIFQMVNNFNVGGTEGQFVGVATKLAERGHHVTVGCLRRQGIYLDVLRNANIEVLEFSSGASLVSRRGVGAMLRLAAYLHGAKFDVVHTHDLYSNLLGVPAAWMMRVPRILASRRDLGTLQWYTPRNQRILRCVLRFSHLIVANSDVVRDHLIKSDGFDPSRVRVLHNGIDLDRFSNLTAQREELLPDCLGKRLVIVSANMHSHTKGHADIITAATSVCSIFPDCVFVLVGDGELRPEFESRVHALGLQANFRFLGARRDVPAILTCCDIGLLASHAEGLPNALLEYMAAGLPVVATAVGGIPEILGESKAGLLVPPSNPDALAQAATTLLADPERAAAMGQAARRRVQEEFSFDRLLDRLESLYSEIKPFPKDETSERRTRLSDPNCESAKLAAPKNVAGRT